MVIVKKNKRGFQYPNTASCHCNITTTVIECVNVAGSFNMVTQKRDSFTGRVSIRVLYLPYPLRLPPIILPYYLTYPPSVSSTTTALHKHATVDTTHTTRDDASILTFDDRATTAEQDQQRRRRQRPSPRTRSVVEQVLQQRVRMAQQRQQHQQRIQSPQVSSVSTSTVTDDLSETSLVDDNKSKKKKKTLNNTMKRAVAGLSVAWQHTRTSLRTNVNSQGSHNRH